MPKAMDVEAISVFKVLQGHLHIPRYQRQYSWTEDEHELFWDDLNKDKKSSGIDNFLGEIVLKRMGESDEDGLEVVDGQQRLTTITIMLAVMREHFRELIGLHMKAEEKAEGTHKLIASRDLMYGQRNVIEAPNNGPNNGEFFREFIQAAEGKFEGSPWADDKSNLLVLAYKYFDSRIKEAYGVGASAEEKFSVLDELLGRLIKSMVIQVVLAEDQDAYTIFETLNDRGVPLASSDLIKNTVLSRLRVSGGQDRALARWMSIVERIGGFSEKRFSDINAFLYYQWISRSYVSGSVQQKELRKSVEKYLESGGDGDPKRASEDLRADGYLRDLAVDLEVWGLLSDTSASAWKNAFETMPVDYRDDTVGQIRLLVDGILTCSGMQPTAAVMVTLRMFMSKKLAYDECKRALRSMETFHFLQKGSSQSTQGLRDAYRKYCAALSLASSEEEAQRSVDALLGYLSRTSVRRDITIANIQELKYARSGNPRKFLLYLMGRYSDAMKLKEFRDYVSAPGFVVKPRSFNVILSDPEGGLTLEHVSAQKPAKGASRLPADLVHNIGNLTLVSNPENVRLSNMSFSEKRPILANLRGRMDPILRRCVDDFGSDWDAAEVSARAAHIAEVAVNNIWTFDVPRSSVNRIL